MTNIISSEMYKIRKSKVIYIIGAVLLAFIAFNCFLLIPLLNNIPTDISASDLGYTAATSYTGIDAFNMFFGSDIIFITLGILTTILVLVDFSTGSIRQIISKGVSRIKYIFAKHFAVSLTVSAMLILGSLISVGLATLTSGSTGLENLDCQTVTQLLIGVCGVIVVSFGYTAFAMLICMLIDKMAIALLVNVLIVTISSLIMQILEIVTENSVFYEYRLSNMASTLSCIEMPTEKKLTVLGIFAAVAVVCTCLSALIFRKKDID